MRGKILDTDCPCNHAKHQPRRAADGRDSFVRHAGRLDRHADQVRNGRDRRHGRNAEFHALTSYNKVTVKGVAASRVFFHLKAEAVRMGE